MIKCEICSVKHNNKRFCSLECHYVWERQWECIVILMNSFNELLVQKSLSRYSH